MEVQINLPELHRKQEEILATKRRRNILKCGRRFGKTVLAEDIAINTALDGYPAGYWSPTYKDLHEVWQSLKRTLKDITYRKDEQVKQIELVTGGIIDMWSLDDPDSGRGRKYKVAIIDEAEKAGRLEEAMNGSIIPTLTDFGGDLWVLSSPKFGKTYFKELFEEAKKDDNWQSWKFTTYDNPYIPKEEIDLAKTTLSPLYFNCEFLAEDVDIRFMPAAYNFSKEKHVASEPFTINYNLPLYFSQDFNINPMATVYFQQWFDSKGHHIRFIDEIALFNSGVTGLAEHIEKTFPASVLALSQWTGDETGNARHTSQQIIRGQHLTNWKYLDQRFSLGRRLRLPKRNPLEKDRLDLMNILFALHPDLKFSPTMKTTINELLYTEIDEDGRLVKSNRNKEEQRSDFLDNVGYAFYTWLNDFKDNPAKYSQSL